MAQWYCGYMSLSTDPPIDWARRADGEVHRLIPGVHFDRPTILVRRTAAMWALRNGFRYRSELDDSGAILVRFTPKGPKL